MLHIILYAIVPIFVVMALGYVSGKKGAFSAQNARTLNKVVLNYALPAALFVSIIKANRQMLSEDVKLTIVSFAVLIACFFLVFFVFKYLFRKNTTGDAAVSALISGSPTIGFLGFAVLEPIFGSSATVALVIAIVSIVVNAVGIPIGLSLLNAGNAQLAAANGGKKPNPWKPVLQALAQPVAWAPILAVVLVLFKCPWPAYLDPSFDLIKGANASVAVFAAGITLSSVKIELNGQVFMGTFLKLIIMPLALLVVGLLIGMSPLNLKMLVVAGALPPAFSGIIIASRYNTYVATGTSSLAVSTLLFMAACPFWIWLTDAAMQWFY